MNYRKRFVLAAMLFLLVGIMVPSFISSAAGDKVTKKITKKNENFQVEVTYGLDGYVVWDRPVVVSVTVTSSQNFTGMLKVSPVMDYDMKAVSYGEDISLAVGESKTFRFTLANLSALGKVNVSIHNEKDKLQYAEQDTVTVESVGTRAVIGVLSDDYSALNYFDGLSVQFKNFSGLSSTLELTKDSLSADSYALSILNYIIIDNFDTANLSDEQYAALKEWVNNGGILVLSLGSNYQNVLHKFSDNFVTGTIGSLEKKDIEWGLFTQNDEEVNEAEETEKTDSGIKNIDSVLKNADSVQLEVQDSEEMTDFSLDKTAYKKNVGKGAVVILSYSLGMEPMTSFSGKQAVALDLLTKSATADTDNILNGINNTGYTDWGDSLASYANETKKPSVLLYGLLLLIYVIFVGPGLYLILKAMKKREKIWIAIPLVAVLFTGIIYLTGFLYRVKVPMINSCSIISIDGDVKSENVYTNIICPKAKEYSIEFHGGYSGFRSNMYSYQYSMLSNLNKDQGKEDYMLKKKGDGMEVIIDSSEAFKENNFNVSKTGKNDLGTLDFDLKCYTTGFSGTITNNTNYDLKNVVVNFETYLYRAGDLKKGETVTIDKNKIFQSMTYGTFENIYASTYKNYHSNGELQKLCQIDSTMEQMYVVNQGYCKGNVWAFIENYEPDFVDKSKVKQNGYGVLHSSFQTKYEDVKGTYYPSLKEMIAASQGDFDGENGLMYKQEIDVTYSFENYPGITTLELTTFGKQNANDNPNDFYAEVYAYNPETGDYERIFEKDAVLSGETLEKYIRGNVILLRYKGKGDYYSSYVPRIIARGDK